MITRYGMSDRFGLVALSTVEDEYLSGRASMNCAQATEAEVDDEVKKLIASCYEEAKQSGYFIILNIREGCRECNI